MSRLWRKIKRNARVESTLSILTRDEQRLAGGFKGTMESCKKLESPSVKISCDVTQLLNFSFLPARSMLPTTALRRTTVLGQNKLTIEDDTTDMAFFPHSSTDVRFNLKGLILGASLLCQRVCLGFGTIKYYQSSTSTSTIMATIHPSRMNYIPQKMRSTHTERL